MVEAERVLETVVAGATSTSNVSIVASKSTLTSSVGASMSNYCCNLLECQLWHLNLM